ncbi:MAG: 3'-5' exonuclease [Spirosomataceae bacterium]
MYLFFDTETTGLPRNWKAPITDLNNWPRMVQLAWELYDAQGNRLAQNNDIIQPVGFTIPAESSRIHGISTAKALAEGKNLVEVLNHFEQQLRQATVLVAHNIDFDEKIVGAEFLRNRMINLLPSKKYLCTMKTKAVIDFCRIAGPYGYKWPSLAELHQKLFKTSFVEAHNAAVDIAITAKCFWELRRLGIL